MKKAFTLIELLVVIAIIAILAAIILPFIYKGKKGYSIQDRALTYLNMVDPGAKVNSVSETLLTSSTANGLVNLYYVDVFYTTKEGEKKTLLLACTRNGCSQR